MDRRQAIGAVALAGGFSLLPRIALAAARRVDLTYDADKTGFTIPQDYVGLSYERAQLANQHYFDATNRSLVELVRGLSTRGSLRLGGSSGEHTDYLGDRAPTVPPYEIYGPEHNKTVTKGLFVSKDALKRLRTFLDATGWTCLYGLNLAHTTPTQTAREARDVLEILGPRLQAFQIGNEPDVFRNRFRSANWGPEDYIREWAQHHQAIVAVAPGAKFAGPDVSNKLEFVTAFAQFARDHPDIVMLTAHYYAMGPAGSPDISLSQLMVPEAATATLKQAGIDLVLQASRQSGLPFRMAEGNSCWNGGQPGISDTHASSIWGADAMLRFAHFGCVGMNWHGGGDGVYSPIVGAPSRGFARRPLYYGTQFARLLGGATFLATRANPQAGGFLTYYALRRDGRDLLVAINKSDVPAAVALPGLPRREVIMLTGPSLAATTGTTLKTVSRRPSRMTMIPGATAMLLTLDQT
ncbi:MAG TPA: hypothetical protein VM657_13965 [Sphingomonas sp.]|nr:hypothetical protein [Sphingomonas sp.]